MKRIIASRARVSAIVAVFGMDATGVAYANLGTHMAELLQMVMAGALSSGDGESGEERPPGADKAEEWIAGLGKYLAEIFTCMVGGEGNNAEMLSVVGETECFGKVHRQIKGLRPIRLIIKASA